VDPTLLETTIDIDGFRRGAVFPPPEVTFVAFGRLDQIAFAWSLLFVASVCSSGVFILPRLGTSERAALADSAGDPFQ